MRICVECGASGPLFEGRCFACRCQQAHAAIEALIRKADDIILTAEAAKQSALDLQWQLVLVETTPDRVH